MALAWSPQKLRCFWSQSALGISGKPQPLFPNSLKVKVPKASVLPKPMAPTDSHVLLGKLSLGSRCWRTGPPCVSSPVRPMFPFLQLCVCRCLRGLSLEAQATGGRRVCSGWGFWRLSMGSGRGVRRRVLAPAALWTYTKAHHLLMEGLA